MIKIVPSNLTQLIDKHYTSLSKKIKNEFPCFSIYSIETILKANPKKLDEIARWFLTLSNAEKEQFKYIINLYKNFTKKDKKEYNAYDLSSSLNVTSCPYCNRNYTFTVTNHDNKILRPDIDHFYDKDTYPILALSFYNLIPSCIECNRTIKRTKQFSINTHIHPYTDSLNNYAKFKLKLQNTDFNIDSFSIEFKSNHAKAQKNISDLKLKEIYNQGYKDIVFELVQKSQIYNETYIDELFSKYGNGKVFDTREDLMRLLTCGYVSDEDINKRPLSKLIKDISEDLGLK